MIYILKSKVGFMTFAAVGCDLPFLSYFQLVVAPNFDAAHHTDSGFSHAQAGTISECQPRQGSSAQLSSTIG
ncbi:hypothetical protein NXC12_PD00333 (plasmid) [Rhizobium etli]|uniref:Uncharacterized protein n=1 Tax=Rhizobium etli TaxID=29449 RepID=A0AAN1BLH9_RHIET|nr:hypothetical protein NXC12_PD00333 [Rhizobium etli]